MPKSFFDNPVKKNLTAAGVLRINIWLSIPVPKIKFDPPQQGKSALVSIILDLSSNQQFFPDVEILSKNVNLFSTPWKIIIPLGNSVGDHIWVIQIHLGGEGFFFFTPK